MLTVKQPIEGTPAWDAGLKASDKIVRIENTSTINMDLDEAVSLLRGKVGEPVTIMVERTGWTAPKPFTIVRGRIKIDPVKGELLDGDIGYLKIQSFHKNVAEDMNQFLDAMEKESQDKLQGLIIDLRNNPGGYLNQAIKVSDRFLRNGVIVSTVEGAERTKEETHAKTTSKTLSDLPIAVLVNGNSASASEIVAGALRNQSRAIIIGERSFGKGSVQHLYGNPDESRLKLTVAQYLTPGDQSIQSVGIPPDILLQPSLIRPKGEDAEEMVFFIGENGLCVREIWMDI
jgi:carboxyl-terminal processing protease